MGEIASNPCMCCRCGDMHNTVKGCLGYPPEDTLRVHCDEHVGWNAAGPYDGGTGYGTAVPVVPPLAINVSDDEYLR